MTKPVFWIYGNRRQCLQSWNQILDHVKKSSGEDPNVDTLFCGMNSETATPAQRWATANDLINLMRNRDLFDDRPRIIKVIGIPEGYAEIVDWLNVLNGRNILVFWGPFAYIKPGTKRWISVKTTKLFKTIKKEGQVFEHPIEVRTNSDAVYIIKEVAVEFKKELKSEVARKIVELQGRNLDLLENSIHKLSIYQTGKKITTEDVEACCFSDYSDKIWAFLDILDEQKIDPALDYLQDFYEEDDGAIGENFYGRINRFFGALLQHYLFLMLLKDVCGQSLNATVAQRELTAFKKTTPTLIKEIVSGNKTLDDLECRFTSQYVGKNISSPATQIAFARRKGETYKIVSDLYDTMYWCRRWSSNTAMLRLLLDTFALVACGKLSLDQAAQIRGHRRKIAV